MPEASTKEPVTLKLASPEQAALMKANATKTVVIGVMAIALVVSGIAHLYMMRFRHSFDDLKWYLLASNALGVQTDEIAEIAIGEWAEYIVSFLGNVNKGSIDDVVTRVAAKMTPSQRSNFEVWMAKEATRIKVEDQTIQTTDSAYWKVEKLSRFSGPAWRIVVRANQRFFLGATPYPKDRQIDVEIIAVQLSDDRGTRLGIERITFPSVFTQDGEIVDVLIEN